MAGEGPVRRGTGFLALLLLGCACGASALGLARTWAGLLQLLLLAGPFAALLVVLRRRDLALARAQDQERQLRTLLDTIPDLVWLKDPQGLYLECNRRFQMLYGADREAIIGRADEAFVPPELAAAFRENDRRAIATGGPAINEEHVTFAHDGHQEDLETIKTPLFGADRQLIGVLGTGRDITDRKRAENAALESARLLQEMFEGSPIGMFRSTPEGQFRQVNRALAAMLGYADPQDLIREVNRLGIGEALFETLERRQELVRQLGKHPGTWLVDEIRYRRRDGRFLDAITTLIYNPEPATRPGLVFGFVQDITERKRMENALQESRANLSALIESTQDLIWSVDLEWRLLTFNRALNDHFRKNYGSEARLGATSREFLPPERAAKWPGLYQKAIQMGAYIVEYGLPDGRTIEMAFHPIFRNQEVFGVSVFGKDITERKRAEQEILTLETYLGNVIDSMPSMLVGLSPEGLVTQWNRQAEAATGIEVGQALGRPMAQVLPEFSAWIEPMRAEVAVSGRPAAMEKLLVERSGERAFYDLMLYPLLAKGVQGAVVRIEDVTERTRIQELMVQNEKMMSVGGLAAGMAHEINNPLGIISQAAQNIERRLSPDLPVNRTVAAGIGLDPGHLKTYFQQRQIPEFIASILGAVERAARIVGNMLQFSRRADPTRFPADLEHIVHQALELAANDYDLKKKFDFRSIRIDLEVAPGLPLVPMVGIEVEQVVLNLLKNAAQAMVDNPPERRPRLAIRIRMEPPHLVLEVADNGPGMDDAVRRRIFEPFFTTKEAGVGTGLGLSVSYMIITQNHKGLLEVDSAPGLGARFTIRLPLAPGTPPVPAGPDATGPLGS